MKLKPQRTFWTQVDRPLVYLGSSREDVVPGSASFMTFPEVIRSKEQDAQLVSSFTETGRHAPVLDLDFDARVAKCGSATALRVSCPPVERGQIVRLRKNLQACGLVGKQSIVAAVVGTPEVTIIFCVPIRLVKSSTPGHHHLYIEREISWAQYRWLLLALRDAGIIGKDFCKMSVRSRASFLRQPGIKKEAQVSPAA
ncbi:MAG: hypothetical protein WC892_05100 [Patescibacteria group bacterium]